MCFKMAAIFVLLLIAVAVKCNVTDSSVTKDPVTPGAADNIFKIPSPALPSNKSFNDFNVTDFDFSLPHYTVDDLARYIPKEPTSRFHISAVYWSLLIIAVAALRIALYCWRMGYCSDSSDAPTTIIIVTEREDPVRTEAATRPQEPPLTYEEAIQIDPLPTYEEIMKEKGRPPTTAAT